MNGELDQDDERRDLEEFENWSRHTMIVPIIPKSDPELNFPCDVCNSPAGEKCTDDCEYQVKKLLGL